MSISQYLETKVKIQKVNPVDPALKNAVGILEHYRNLQPLKYQKQIRTQWEKRLRSLFAK